MIDLAAAVAKSPSAWDQPGTLGFLVVFGMGTILYFVFRSLARHLRKINEAARLEAAQAEAAQTPFAQTEATQAPFGQASFGQASFGQSPAASGRASTDSLPDGTTIG